MLRSSGIKERRDSSLLCWKKVFIRTRTVFLRVRDGWSQAFRLRTIKKAKAFSAPKTTRTTRDRPIHREANDHVVSPLPARVRIPTPRGVAADPSARRRTGGRTAGE